MEVLKIADIESLIKDYVNLSNRSVVGQKLTRLTQPGENYGSLMLAVDIVLKNQTDGKEETLKAVAKVIPPNVFLQQYFNSIVTFKNEIIFYTNIVPTLHNFQKQRDVEELRIFPRCLGGRCNLNGGDQVDENTVLLLENLKYAGYQTFESSIGFDFESALMVVKELARFHATTLALKVTNPELFKSKIQKYVGGFKFPADGVPVIVEAWKNILEANKETIALAPRIIKTMSTPKPQNPKEPLATLIHNDFWVNNIMVKLENNKVTAVKMVDFQVCDYGSPFSDLLFFLFSSVQIKILDKNFDNFVKNYHEYFSLTLDQLNCKSSKISIDEMMKEIECEAKSEFFHIAFMVFPILADKSIVPDLSALDRQQFLVGTVNQVQKEKAWFLAKEFTKRNWLYD